MIIKINFIISIILLTTFTSCEEVIEVDLNSSNPAFVAEAIIYKDSVSQVRLTRTSSFFSLEKPEFIEDAVIRISDGAFSDELTYIRNGYYSGNSIRGTEGKTYKIEIIHNGKTYTGKSFMPVKSSILSVRYGKSDSPGVLNPLGETVFTITCEFTDNPGIDNFYLIRFMSDGRMLERYYLLTDKDANSGEITNDNGTISFSESIFYEGGEVDVQVFSIDKSVYDYYLQLTDILFWKRRVMPPTPYNPVSNINNGALGYFAAWAYDTEKVMLN